MEGYPYPSPMLRRSAAVLALAFPLTALAAFRDVPPGAWFAAHVETAAEMRFVEGYRDAEGNLTGEFGPGNPVTVAEAVKMTMVAAGLGPLDREPGGHWSDPYFALAEGEGIELPEGLATRRDAPATRAEVSAIVAAAYQGAYLYGDVLDCNYSDVPLDHPGYYGIRVVTGLDIMVGDGRETANEFRWDWESGEFPPCVVTTFRPSASINRAEMAKVAVTARGNMGTRAEAIARFRAETGR